MTSFAHSGHDSISDTSADCPRRGRRRLALARSRELGAVSVLALAVMLANTTRSSAQTIVTINNQADVVNAINLANAGNNVIAVNPLFFADVQITGALPAVTAGSLTFGHTAGSFNSGITGGSLTTNVPLGWDTPTGLSDAVTTNIGGSGSVTVQESEGIDTRITLSGTNSYSGGTTVIGGIGLPPNGFGNRTAGVTLLFDNPASLPSSGPLTLQSGGVVAANFAIDQSFLNRITPSSVGGVAITPICNSNLACSADFNDLDFSALPNVSFGGAAQYVVESANSSKTVTRAIYAGHLTPYGNTYQLGTLNNDTLSISGVPTLDILSNLGDAHGAPTNVVVQNDDFIELDGANTYTGGTHVTSGAKLGLGSAASLGGTGTNLQIDGGAGVVAYFSIDQNFLNRITPASQGFVTSGNGINSNPLDFNQPGLLNVSLGGNGTGSVYSGTLTPAADTYRLGGFAALEVDSVLAGANGVVTSGSSVTLANTDTYTGPTTVNGYLILGNRIANGAINNTSGVVLPTALGSTLEFQEASAVTFDRAVSGAGGILQVGPGTVTLTGPMSYTGGTTVFGGTLDVETSLTSSSLVDVFSDPNPATLTGTGSVGALNVELRGTFIPGTAGQPGTSMTVGTLTIQHGGTYQVYFNPTTASFASVSGGTTLSGGTVNAIFASGSYSPHNYEIVVGSHTGSFEGLNTTNLPAGVTAMLDYSNPNGIFLDLTGSGDNSGGGGGGNGGNGGGTNSLINMTGLNLNQQSLAVTLNNYSGSGGALPAAFLTIGGLTGTPLSQSLSQLDGEASNDAERGVFNLMTQFLALMLDPFVDGRGGIGGNPVGAGRPAFAPEQDQILPPDLASAYAAMVSKAPPKPIGFDRRWTVWGSAFGGANTSNGDPAVGSNSVTASDFGFAGGLDYHFNRETTAGFAIAGGGTNWGLAQNLGGGRSDAFQAGVHGSTHVGPAYFAGAAAFADHWFTTSRTAALGDQLTARFQGTDWGGRGEAGYRYALLPTIGLAPYAAIQSQVFHTPAYSETDLTGGGFGLSYSSQSSTDTRSELGARLDDVTMLGAMPVVLRARLAWAHDWVSNPALTAAFQALPGASFTVNGAPIPKNSALTTAAAQLYLSANWSLLAKFDGEFGKGSQTYAGTGTLRYTW